MDSVQIKIIENRPAYHSLTKTIAGLAALLVFFFLTFNISSAHADQFATDSNALVDYNSFAAFIRGAKQDGSISKEMETRILFDVRSPHSSQINGDYVHSLEAIAKMQAQVWSDTILEGDYAADGSTQLDRVEGLFLHGELVAYRITYSERAWQTSDCEIVVDGYQHKYSNCLEGRISESSFVSPNFAVWLRDDRSYAEFE